MFAVASMKRHTMYIVYSLINTIYDYCGLPVAYYSANRILVNIAFLRLFLYVQTNRRLNIKINTSIHRLIGDIF